MESYGDETSELTYGIGYLVNLIPFGLCLYDMCKNRNITQTALIVFVISSMAYEISPFGRLLPMISRTAFYFQAYYILAFPRAYSYVKSNMIRNFALAIFVVMSLVSYHRFLVDPTFVDSYSTFHTIFEAL